MKLGAFVITYNRPKILAHTIEAVFAQTLVPDTLLVLDNGSSEETHAVVRSFATSNLTYHDTGDNIGPAGATAIGLDRLAKEGYDWIYWIDDDNPPLFPDTLERLLTTSQQVEQENLGGIGGVGCRFDWRIGEMARLPDSALHGVVDVDMIGGGQQFLLRGEMVKSVGVTDPGLFFGLYEPEYCLRVRRAGYRLIIDGELMWEGRNKTGRLNLVTSKDWIPQYSFNNMWQRYYRTRNYIFMMKYTFQRPDLARREALKAFGRTGFSWLRGPRYGATFSALQSRGVLDGYLQRMGRTVLPKAKYGHSAQGG